MSSDLAVRLEGVSKSYTVYTKPRYWLAEFLGLGRLLREGRHYRNFWALRDIDLEIPKGARVAIVGRNGAGKSTLLRIISENVAATTGMVEVHGRCEALMQLGTGFNPEFTGRECVRTALAYMGVTGGAAEEKVRDVLEFSELDEFIDQPVRTYSSGMYLRLAFSVATMIAPEILIIDEVLGAGDLYFQSKCLARIQSLASGPGTTVLFVSHDLGAAQRLCDTFVWLDRGRIVARGPAADVRAAYEDSVRRQQELRLRARNLRLSSSTASVLERSEPEGTHLVGHVLVEGPARAAGPEVHALRVFVRGSLAEEIRVGDAMDDAAGRYPSFLITDPAESAWGEPQERDGRRFRLVRRPAEGGLGARFALFVHDDDFSDRAYEASLEVVYRDTSRDPSHIEVHAGAAGMKWLLSLEHAGDLGWKSARTALPTWILGPSATPGAPAASATGTMLVPPSKRFGTGQVRIQRLRFLTDEDRETYVFRHGCRMVVEIVYRAEDSSIVGTTMVCAVGFLGIDGLQIAANISSAEGRTFEVTPRGTIRIVFDPLLLANGTYRFSVGLFSRMDLQGYNPHFTASPFLYDLLARSHEFVMEGAHPAESWLFRHPVRWEEEGKAT
jgi:lipopolysaccharide transport system ATP-binding protein